MRFTADTSALLDVLSIAARIAKPNNGLPILGNVLLRTEGRDKLTVAATDLCITMTTTAPVKVIKPGAITVSARDLLPIIKAMDSATVEIGRGDNNYCEIKAGRASFKLVALADTDFPKLPKAPAEMTEIKSAEFAALVERVIYAAGNDNTRAMTLGVRFITVDGVTRATATDGHRLADAYAEIGDMGATETAVYATAIAEILRANGGSTFEWATDAKTIHIRTAGGVEMAVARIADATTGKIVEFPPFDQVIPKKTVHVVHFGRAELSGAIRRMALLVRDKGYGVKAKLESDELSLWVADSAKGEAAEVVPCQYDGACVDAQLNPSYILDALARIEGEKIAVGLDDNEIDKTGKNPPCLLAPIKIAAGGKDCHVVMPMRL